MLPLGFEPHYITVQDRDDVRVVSFVLAELTDDENVEILGRELFCLVDQYGCQRLVLDLNGVRHITSSVLGKIITLHRKLRRSEGKLVLCGIEPGVAETLQTSRLLNYFTTAENVSAALHTLKTLT